MPRVKDQQTKQAKKRAATKNAAADKAAKKAGAKKRDPNAELAKASRAQDARQAKKASAKKKATAKKKASAKKGNGASYGRKHALHDALAKGGTRDELAAELNARYVKAGGSDNPTNSRNWVNTFVPVLEHFGVVQRDKDGRFRLRK